MALLLAVLERLPLRVAWVLCWGLAWAWWWVVPVRRRVAVVNLRAAFPHLRPGPTLRRMMAELALGYVELVHHWRRRDIRVEVEGAEPVLEALRAGLGVVLVAGHLGSWDVVGPAVREQLDLPAHVIVKPPAAPWAARLVEAIRRSFGMELLPPSGCMPQVEALLRSGRMVVFVNDQRHNRGIPVPFLGREAWTAPSPVLAATRTGAPIHVLLYGRDGIGRHRARFVGPIRLSGDLRRDVAACHAPIEDAIRQRPHGWLWLHDRWRRPASAQGGPGRSTPAGP